MIVSVTYKVKGHYDMSSEGVQITLTGEEVGLKPPTSAKDAIQQATELSLLASIAALGSLKDRGLLGPQEAHTRIGLLVKQLAARKK